MRGRLERAAISRARRAGLCRLCPHARRARSRDRRAAAACRRAADRRVRRGRRPRSRQAAGDGRGRRRASPTSSSSPTTIRAARTPAAIRAEILAGAPGATEIGDRRDAIAAAIAEAARGDIVLLAGKGHETGPDRRRHGAAVRRCRRWRGSARARMTRALDLRRDRRRDRRRRATATSKCAASPSIPARSAAATCSSRCPARRPTATASSTAPSRAARPGRSCRSRSTARMSCVADTFAGARGARRAPRARADRREDLRRHRLGRQDRHQGSAVRRARPRSRRARSIARSRATTTIPACR